MITNVLFENLEFDCVLLTEKGVIIIDCKAYQGEVAGLENGSWKVKMSNGKTVEIQKNPYKQMSQHHFQFRKRWLRIVETHFADILPEGQKNHFSNWLYFQPGSDFSGIGFDFERMKWFNIITKDTLIDAIENLDAEYLFTKSDYDKILLNFGLDLPRDDEELYPGDEDESIEDSDEIPDTEPITKEEISTPAGAIPVIIQVGVVQIKLPVKPVTRTPEFMNALNEALVFYESDNLDRALNLVQYALEKDPHDQESQDLKYDILCRLGREKEAEEFLSQSLRG